VLINIPAMNATCELCCPIGALLHHSCYHPKCLQLAGTRVALPH
jgi:hypothetical protein